MTQHFYIHPENPQGRLIQQAARILEGGGIVALPTDASFVLACLVGETKAMMKIQQIRQLDKNHLFTLMCRDLSEIATYAKVDNSMFRILKHDLPAPVTFILQASKEVPKRLAHAKRKTVGIRVPDDAICQALLAEINQPLLVTTLKDKQTDELMVDSFEVEEQFDGELDLIITGNAQHLLGTTVVDLSNGVPEVIRQGLFNFDDSI